MDWNLNFRFFSNVNNGIYLSGGIDSSIMTMAAKDYSNSFNYSHNLSFSEQSFDESVTLARRELMRVTSARPAILSGGFPYVSYDRWTQNLGRTLRNYQP